MPTGSASSKKGGLAALPPGRGPGPTVEEQLLFHCERGDAASAVQVLKKQPDCVNAPVGGDQGTALHHAAMRGHLVLTQKLLEAKANVESKGYTGGLTPLHLAAEEDQPEVCLELISQKANPNQTDDQGQTPAHRAAFAGAAMALRVLLASGGDASLQDEEKSTPLHYAAYAGRLACVKAITEAQPEVVNNRGGGDEGTALHLAAAAGRPDVLTELINAGLDISLMDESRMTALHRAAAGCAVSTKLLLDAKADPMAEDSSRWTPLHYACEYDLRGAVKALLEGGARVDVFDSRRLTPLHVAAQEGHVLTCAMLMGAKADPKVSPAVGVVSPLQLARREKATNHDLLSLFEMGDVRDPQTKQDLLSLFEMGYVRDPAMNQDLLSLFEIGYGDISPSSRAATVQVSA